MKKTKNDKFNNNNDCNKLDVYINYAQFKKLLLLSK